MTDLQTKPTAAAFRPKAPWDLSVGVVLLVITAGLLAAISVMLVRWDVDRTVAGFFYSTETGWRMNQAPLWTFLEDCGPLPGVIGALLALAGLLAGRVKSLAVPWRRFFCLVVLTTFIGPGLLVNVAVKDHWGRPRPRETVDFGGLWEYREFYQPGIPGKGKSFPCGHCSVGFIFLTLYFYPTNRRRVRLVGAAFGLFWGTLLSIARISQGAHFVTDTLWSFGLITMVILTLWYVVINSFDYWKTIWRRMTFPGKAIWSTIAGSLCLTVVLVFFTNRPFYQTDRKILDISPATKRIEIRTNFIPESTQVMYLDSPRSFIRINSHGFGEANVDIHFHTMKVDLGSQLLFYGRLDPDGFFMKLSRQVVVGLPLTLKDRVRVEFRNDEMTEK